MRLSGWNAGKIPQDHQKPFLGLPTGFGDMVRSHRGATEARLARAGLESTLGRTGKSLKPSRQPPKTPRASTSLMPGVLEVTTPLVPPFWLLRRNGVKIGNPLDSKLMAITGS